jgi:hypothetical protein
MIHYHCVNPVQCVDLACFAVCCAIHCHRLVQQKNVMAQKHSQPHNGNRKKTHIPYTPTQFLLYA